MVDNKQSTYEILRSIRRLLHVLVFISLGVLFYFAKDIIMPITLGVLITLTLSPVVRFLTRAWIPPAVAALLVVMTAGGFLGMGVYALSEPLNDVVSSLPRMGDEIKSKLKPYRSSLNSISEATKQVEELTNSVGEEKPRTVAIEQPPILSVAASSVAGGVTSFALAFVLALFMLSSGRLFYEKIVGITPVLSEKKKALRIVLDVESNVSRYLLTITVINALLGIVIGLALYYYGMPNAMLWGAIAAVFNFLPFIGAFIGAGLVTAVSMGVFDTLSAALIPGGIYLACSMTEGNLLTPMIVGRRLEINTVVVFLSVAIWAWLWGIVGALMAVPILVVVKVLADHVESWKIFGDFLSAQTKPVID